MNNARMLAFSLFLLALFLARPVNAACTGSASFSCADYFLQEGVGCASEAPASCSSRAECFDQQGNSQPCEYFCEGSFGCGDLRFTEKCSEFGAKGCSWQGEKFGLYRSYGEPCSTSSQCASGLFCDSSGKCNQQQSVCSYLPEKYVEKPQNSFLSGAGGPKEITEELEGGAGVGPEGSRQLSGTSLLYQVGWFSDWKTAGLIGVAIAVGVIAIAAMIGHGFNLPEVKAFVDTELSQAVVSVLLIFALMGLIAFFDQTARLALPAAELPVAPEPGEPAYITAAKFYLGNLYETADGYAKSQLTEAIRSQAAASEGVSTQFNLWYLAFAGTSMRLNAGLSMDAERHSALFEAASKLMASLYAQRYFLDAVAYAIAPVLMLLGILLRTFFFTRRLGGLLLAIAISLFIVYPLTYAFAWYTLNVTIYGDRMIASPEPSCPAECTTRYPVAFYVQPSDGSIVGFETVQQIIRAGINKDNWATGDVNKDDKSEFPGLVACRDLSAIGLASGVAPNQCSGCPDYCREVPFPSSLPGCDIAACSACNPGCKLLRQRTDCTSQCDMVKCGMSCRTKTPVENRCYDANEGKGGASYVPADLSVSCAGCNGCPSWCRIVQTLADGSTELLYKSEPGCQDANGQVKKACLTPEMGGNCPLQCMYQTPIGASSKCDTSCSYNGVTCPYFCRVKGISDGGEDLSRYDTTQESVIGLCNDPSVAEACSRCPADCTVSAEMTASQKATCAPYPDKQRVSQNCNDCPQYCRWDDYGFITDEKGRFYDYSITSFAPGQEVPYVCQQGLNGRLNCGGSACGAACNVQEIPKLCRIFNQADTDHPYDCRLCPPEARVNFTYTDGEGKTSAGTAMLVSGLRCEDTYCPPDVCKRTSSTDPSPIFSMPGPAAGCFDYNATYDYLHNPMPQNCQLCQPFCRIMAKSSPSDQNGLDKNLRAAACNSVTQTRSQVCGLGSNAVCADPRFDDGYCCSDGLQCGPAPDLQKSSTEEVLPGAAGTLSVETVNPYKGGDPQYYWSFTATGELVEGETITWTAGGKAGKGLSGEGLSPLISLGKVTFSNDGKESNITGMSVDYYGYSPGTKKCATCESQLGLHDSCADNYTAGCCGTDQTYGKLTCDSQTRTCEPVSVTIDPCSATPDPLWGNAVYCPSSCQYPAEQGIVCSEYRGNGPKCEADSNNKFNFVDCKKYSTEETCDLAPEGCHWRNDPDTCTGPPACAGYFTPEACAKHEAEGCRWQTSDSVTVPIDLRKEPYNERSACAQCPEHCRILGMSASEQDCGIVDSNNNYVDCRAVSCPDVCKVSAPATGACGPADSLTQQCEGCQALCRRNPGNAPDDWPDELPPGKAEGICPTEDYCSYTDTTYRRGCYETCRLQDAPVETCEACYDCPLDCTFYPAVRTDCSEVCSDSALAAPVSAMPSDFIKKLPGAQGAEDAKGIGSLMVPALVLPLFCLVMVIAFIRVLSPALGGDIEIPGLGRII